MTCTKCGATAPASARFCPECGTSLQASCTSCGSALLPSAKFCAECGTPTGASATAASSTPGTNGAAPTGPVAERRLVSILFADLVGFTTLSDGRDAEETRELLSRYFELAGEVIGRYGGTIEKFIGDAVMAVWGTPIARENDAERAVRAALDLVAAVKALGPGLDARAGVLTGETAVTIGATNQGMVAGDIVNTASRLQSVAQPGTVLVGESTERATNEAIAYEAAGEQLLKGKTAPVPAFRAIRVVAERGGRGRGDRLEAQLVGRDGEFRLLKDLVHGTGEEKRTRVVSLIGVAGSGKSRLLWELSKYLDGVVETVWWHTGRSPAYGEGITFWALGEMVRNRAGLAETDDEATTRTKLSETVARWVTDETERRWIESALLVLLGVDGAAALSREELFAAWRTFFERIAAKGTVVLVFEDLHWADQGTLDFIDHVAEWSRGRPILVITLARPEILERRPDWGAGRRNFISIGLEPLSDAAIHDLLTALVPGLPPAALQAISERADGIPLYAIEMIRMLVAEGRLVPADGGYAPAGDLTNLAIPETLHALIAARLDALPGEERSVIQDAAVLGQSFTLDGLAAVSSLQRDQVDEIARSLVRRELLAHDLDPRSAERGQYSFVQALIREVAYGTLARRDRRSRHLAAARFFESLGEEELAGALASHYLDAFRAAPDDPDSRPLATQARIALRAAATRASSLGSNDQAVVFLTEAIEVTDDPTEVADLLEQAGVAAVNAGRIDFAEPTLRDVIERRLALGDRPGAARATAALGRGMVNAWDPGAAVELLEPASEAFADLADDAALADIEHQLARGYWFNDRVDQAVDLADRALGRAERIEDIGIIADALITKGVLLAWGSRPYEGTGSVGAGVRLAEEHGLQGIHARGLLNLGVIALERQPRLSLERSRAALTLAARYGFAADYATALGNAAEAAVAIGEWDWALDATTDEAIGHLAPADRTATMRARVEILAARGEAVDDILDEYERLTAGTSDSQTVSNRASTQAAAAFATGRYRDATDRWLLSSDTNIANASTDVVRAARAMLWADDVDGLRAMRTRLEDPSLPGSFMGLQHDLVSAAIAAIDGDRAGALESYREALRQLAERELVYEQAMVSLDMARVLGTDEPFVRSALADARAILAQLGARPYLERLDALLAAGDSATARGVRQAAATSPIADR